MSEFCQHNRVADRCHECEAIRLRSLVLALAEKLWIVAGHLASLAERKEARST